MRCWCRRRLASSRETFSRTVTRLSLVINSATGWRGSLAKRTSRLVRMPTSGPPPRSTTGIPEILFSAISRNASARVSSGWIVTGLTTIPASNFLTLRTSSACSAIGMLRWITPMPPAWAIAIAKAPSVTVSIAAEISGMPSLISRVSRVPGPGSADPRCEGEGVLGESDDAQVVGRGMAGRRRRHVAQHDVGEAAERLAGRRWDGGVANVAGENCGAQQRRGRGKIDADDNSVPADARDGDLRPAARCTAEIDDPLARAE